jgi:serine/threonine protein kinase
MLVAVLGGRYCVIQHLGGGGFSQTYLARDQHLPEAPLCVVKHFKPQVTHPQSLAAARRLFVQEAEVLHKLGRHDRIPQLYAHFEQEAEFYLVLEYIVGHDLQQEFVPGRVWTEAEVIDLLRQVLDALAFVHQQGVIHRDVKPANLVRRQSDSKIVLIDFGAVKQVSAQTEAPGSETGLTVPIGSPGYMPPEQSRGKPRYASDIYAVGMLGIQALTGLIPDSLPEDAETGEMVWRDQAPGVSPELARVLDRMVQRDFRHRYANAHEAIRALELRDRPHLSAEPVEPLREPVSPKRRLGGDRLRKLGIGFAGATMLLGGLATWHWQWLANHTPLLCHLQQLPNGTYSYSGGTTWFTLRNAVEPNLPKLCPQFRLRYIEPLFDRPSSGASIQMVLNDQIDFAQSTRALKEKERATARGRGFELQQIPVALDGIAIAAHPSLAIPGLTMAQVKNILSGKITNWQQVGGANVPLTIYNANPQDSSTMEFLQSNFLDGQPIRRDLKPAGNITQALRNVASDPGGIHFASAAHLVGQCTVRTLPIGVRPDKLIPPYAEPAIAPSECSETKRNQPNVQAFQGGAYPLTRSMFVIVKRNGQAAQQAGEAYTRLLLSGWGQDAIEQAGFVRVR